ncbi:MAG: rRNA maturation RNase YbeY [Treponema sp.]|jgi:probable rRNA maturation factor|nr:rRNA maturation RNase YbeY [Treponema sp.]
MNRVAVKAEEVPLPPWIDYLSNYIVKVLNILDKDNWDVSVLLCNDSYIRGLNTQYRGKDEATDILSFPLGETVLSEGEEKRYLPGDLVISLETLEENARYFGVSPDEELRRLLIHGILHLDGMDHKNNEPAEPMLIFQEKLLAGLGAERVMMNMGKSV